MMNGFRNFILRGNVVDLAVGVIIGAAFGAVVSAFTTGFINPLIKAVTGGPAKVGGTFVLNGSTFDYGLFISAVINFLIIAAVVYFLVVLPINKLTEHVKTEEKPAAAEPSNSEKLLAQIRDELKSRPLG